MTAIDYLDHPRAGVLGALKHRSRGSWLRGTSLLALLLTVSCSSSPKNADSLPSGTSLMLSPILTSIQDCVYTASSGTLVLQASFHTVAKSSGESAPKPTDLKFLALTTATATTTMGEVDVPVSYDYSPESSDSSVTLTVNVSGGIPSHVTVDRMEFTLDSLVHFTAGSVEALKGHPFAYPFGRAEVENAEQSAEALTITLHMRPAHDRSSFLDVGVDSPVLTVDGKQQPLGSSNVTPGKSDYRQELIFASENQATGTVEVALPRWAFWTANPVVIDDLPANCESH
jgi:hypothetical protein